MLRIITGNGASTHAMNVPPGMSWADDPEPADSGTQEYLAFCRAIGAEPTIVVNVEGRGATLSEAAELRLAGKDPLKRESCRGGGSSIAMGPSRRSMVACAPATVIRNPTT